jgi:hypothetical protein
MKNYIKEIISSTFAGYHSEGLKVYSLLEKEIAAQNTVDISFKDVESCSTMFLNACIGKLYLTFPKASIEKLLIISDTSHISNFDKKLGDVISNALNSEIHDQIIREATFA